MNPGSEGPEHRSSEVETLRARVAELEQTLEFCRLAFDAWSREEAGGSEAYFRAVFESNPTAMVIVDREGRIVLANAVAERLFGYPRRELEGQVIESLLPARFRPGHPGYREGFMGDPRSRPMGAGRDLYGCRKDGSEVPVEIALNPITVDGRTMVLSVIVDITERRRAEERFRLAVESAPNAMIMVDARGMIVMVNSEAERLFGYPREEMVGQQVEMLLPDRFKEGHPPLRAAFHRTPAARRMGAGRDLFARRRDGSEVPVEIGLNPLETEEGTMVLSAIVDISERKAAEARLRGTAEDLARSNAELEQFAYVASHDLQEPLRMVASYTQLLAHRYRGRLDQDADEFIGYAVDGVQRMQRMINELLEYSRVSSGESFEPVDCNDVVHRVLEDLRVTIEEADALIDVQRLPVVQADAPQLARVFQNLISNAIKYRSGSRPAIRIWAQRIEGDWRFAVFDNGIGIDAQFRERIFIIFQRLHSRRQYSGTGLGLALCRRIIERHSGRIWVEGNERGGSTFWFTLPDSGRDSV